jgi:Ca-activated chloride channel family protein
VTIITFSDHVMDNRDFMIQDATQADQLRPISDYVDSLQAGGGTAIYDAMDQAFQVADQARSTQAGYFVSVVLMTDGENNSGEDSGTFLAHVQQLQHHDIPAFPILFGEGDMQQLQEIASVTGGKLFNSQQASLASTFQEIRGYQ